MAQGNLPASQQMTKQISCDKLHAILQTYKDDYLQKLQTANLPYNANNKIECVYTTNGLLYLTYRDEKIQSQGSRPERQEYLSNPQQAIHSYLYNYDDDKVADDLLKCYNTIKEYIIDAKALFRRDNKSKEDAALIKDMTKGDMRNLLSQIKFILGGVLAYSHSKHAVLIKLPIMLYQYLYLFRLDGEAFFRSRYFESEDYEFYTRIDSKALIVFTPLPNEHHGSFVTRVREYAKVSSRDNKSGFPIFQGFTGTRAQSAFQAIHYADIPTSSDALVREDDFILSDM